MLQNTILELLNEQKFMQRITVSNFTRLYPSLKKYTLLAGKLNICLRSRFFRCPESLFIMFRHQLVRTENHIFHSLILNTFFQRKRCTNLLCFSFLACIIYTNINDLISPGHFKAIVIHSNAWK